MDARDWVGGIVTLPSYVTGDGEPYRPELLVWASLDGVIRAVDVLKPGEAIQAAPFHLKRTIGNGEAPLSVRVASPELAEALAPAFRTIAIRCAPTPEIDALINSLAEFRSQNPIGGAPTYFDCGVEEPAIASFFRAAKRFYESSPWDAWEGPCTISIPELDIQNGAVSLMGMMREHYGFLLFASTDDLDRFGMGAIDVEEGREPVLPPHTALEFEPRKAMPPAMVAEVKLHGWKIAGAKAYPLVHVIDADFLARGPTPREIAVLEALCIAFVQALECEPAAAYSYRVQTSAGPVNVDLRWEEEGEAISEEEAEKLAADVMARFAASTHAKALDELRWSEMFCHYLHALCGITVDAMTAVDASDVIFGVFPDKVMCDPEDAESILLELRAFFSFLGREDCLDELDEKAEKDLEALLANPDNYGMAKSLMSTARAQGFDVETEQGLQAFIAHVNAQPRPRTAPRATVEKKKKRKAQRKARQRSR